MTNADTVVGENLGSWEELESKIGELNAFTLFGSDESLMETLAMRKYDFDAEYVFAS